MSITDDIVEIQALGNKYGAAAAVFNAERQASCFTDDAEYWGLSAMVGENIDPLVGPEVIAKFLASTHVAIEYINPTADISDIEVDGDTATSHTQLTEFCKMKDGPLLLMLGDFKDEYRRVDGRWLFSGRWFTSKKVTALTEAPLG